MVAAWAVIKFLVDSPHTLYAEREESLIFLEWDCSNHTLILC